MNLSFESKILGKSIQFLPSCHSTNDLMLNYAKSNKAVEGHVIWTLNQTHGRGQRGNTWEAESEKNLTFSLLICPKISSSNQFNLNMLVALAVKDCIQKFTNFEVLIKWPNDIYVKTDTSWKKISGMLIENIISGHTIQFSVIGIGININQESFSNLFATSLFNLEKTTFEIKTVLNDLLLNLEKYYLNPLLDYSNIKYLYTKNLLYYSEERIFEDDRGKFKATLLGIDEIGKLSLNVGGKVKKFDIKEVKFVIE